MTDISPIAPVQPGLYKRQMQPVSLLDKSLLGPAIWA